MLRAVVQAGITDLTVVGEFYPVFCHRDIVCRTASGTDASVNTAVVHGIGQGGVFPQPVSGDTGAPWPLSPP